MKIFKIHPLLAPMPTTGSGGACGIVRLVVLVFFVTDGFHEIDPCVIALLILALLRLTQRPRTKKKETK